MRRRCGGWWLLEALLGATVAACYLALQLALALGAAHRHALAERRLIAYFLARGMASELALQAEPSPFSPRDVDLLRGIRADLSRMPAPRRRALRTRLSRLRVALRNDQEEWRLEVTGPGVREHRLLRTPAKGGSR